MTVSRNAGTEPQHSPNRWTRIWGIAAARQAIGSRGAPHDPKNDRRLLVETASPSERPTIADILPPSEEPPSLYRIRFAPGIVYALEVSPAVSLVYVEAGTLVLRLDAPVTVMRAGETDTPGEAIAAGAEVTLGPGDYTVLPPHIGGDARNDGQDPAQVAVAELLPEQLAMSLTGTPVP